MKNLNKRDIDLIKLAEKGGNDSDLFILDKINEALNDIEAIKKGAEERIDIVAQNIQFLADKIESIKWKKGDRGERGKPGRDGKDGKSIKGDPGKDGKDADEEKIIKEVLKQIPKPKDGKDGINGADGSPDTPEMVRDKLEFLKGEERLDISAIKGLKTKLYNLSKRPTRVGGGTSAIGVANAMGTIVKTETPSGLINGVNKVYTVENTINAILSFGINGMVIHPDTDYTYSGRTITFTDAIPASLAGTSFKIVYL